MKTEQQIREAHDEMVARIDRINDEEGGYGSIADEAEDVGFANALAWILQD